MAIVKDVLLAVLGPGVLLVGYLMSDRRSQRAQQIDDRQATAEERQASAAEGQSVATLASQVVELAGKIGVLDAQVRALQADNGTLKARLDSTQDRLTAAVAYIAELIRWVEGGAHAPVPQPGLLIARDVILPPSWMHQAEGTQG